MTMQIEIDVDKAIGKLLKQFSIQAVTKAHNIELKRTVRATRAAVVKESEQPLAAKHLRNRIHQSFNRGKGSAMLYIMGKARSVSHVHLGWRFAKRAKTIKIKGGRKMPPVTLRPGHFVVRGRYARNAIVDSRTGKSPVLPVDLGSEMLRIARLRLPHIMKGHADRCWTRLARTKP